MSALPPNNKPRRIDKRRRVVSKTFTALDETNLSLVVIELQDRCRELQQAVQELQDTKFVAEFVDPDGQPANNTLCKLVDGHFVKLIQAGAAPQIVTIEHQLGRKPQGILWILSGNSNNQVLVSGSISSNIMPADERQVSFRLNGSSGDMHVGILF